MSDLTGYALLLYLTTTQRQDKIASMRRGEINGDTWIIPAGRAKNGLAHRVPLSLQTKALLDAVNEISASQCDRSGHKQLAGCPRFKIANILFVDELNTKRSLYSLLLI